MASATGGMWGGNTGSFWKPPSGFDATTGNVNYDISNIAGGTNMLKQQNYKPTSYNPYQFNRTSDQEFGDVYGKAMSTATRPLIAQGAERMRQASQGWGANQMSSAAGKELAMKNAQKTGSDIADIGRSIGSSMATARMAEGQEVQRQQAAENFKSAGFSDEQAKALADDITKRAGALIGTGMNWATFQRGVNQDSMNSYNNSDFSSFM